MTSPSPSAEGPPPALTPSAVAEMLGNLDLFAELSPPEHEALVAGSEVVPVARGQVVMRQGEVADCAYVVLRGRFTVSTLHDGLTASTNIYPGELVGELGLLAGVPRSATVTAARDGELLRITATAFERFVVTRPQALLALARRLALRAGTIQAERRPHVGREVVAIVAVGGIDPAPLMARLADAIVRLGETSAAVTADDIARADQLLAQHHHVFVVGQAQSREDLRRLAGAADRTIAVVPAGLPAEAVAVMTAMEEVELVVVHPHGRRRPTGTAAVVAAARAGRWHHVRLDRDDDLDRLARWLSGRAVGLALSGGAARGLVHIGVHRALLEHHVPIDAVAGTSSGSIIAGGIAMGFSPAEVADRFRQHLGGRSPIDPTLPVVALAAGRRMTGGLKAVFGDSDLEDCWLPMVAVSTNLTSLTEEVHRTGPLWRAVRASASIPGVFPPVVTEAGVLVDGGLVDNLPVQPLRDMVPGCFVVSSLVGGPDRFAAGSMPTDGIVRARAAAEVLARRNHGTRSAGIVSTLIRLSALGGSATRSHIGDLHVEHDVSAWGSFDWKALDAIAAHGHVTTVASLQDAGRPWADRR